MITRVLQGPFLTRGQAARRAKLPALVLAHRRDLLSITGRWLSEVYFEFQFDDHGVRTDVATVVREMKYKYTDIEIGDWLIRRNRHLDGFSPLGYLNAGGDRDHVLEAAVTEGPIFEDRPPASEWKIVGSVHEREVAHLRS